MVRSDSSCSTLPTARTCCTMERASTFSVFTPMRWILSRLTLTVPGVILLVLIDGDVVHPHGVLLRHRRGVGQPHGIAVVENLPLRPVAAADCSAAAGVETGAGSGRTNSSQRSPAATPSKRMMKLFRRLMARLRIPHGRFALP